MEYKLSEEQVEYADVVRNWLAETAPVAVVRDWLDSGDASVFEAAFAEDGWVGIGLAEKLGGQGGGLVELALTAEEFARATAPSASWLATALALPALASRGDIVESVIAGEVVALLIPADDVPDAIEPLSIDAGGAVSGSVARVLAGDRARRFVVVAGDAERPQLRLVKADAPGVRITSRRLLDRTRSVADVMLTAVESEPIDVDAAGFLASASARAAVLVAADALGASERLLELAVDYSKQRTQFGVPIGSFQAVKHAAATILVSVEAARSVVQFAAASVDAGLPESSLHAAAAKAQVTEAAAQAADSALTMMGAIAYTWEHEFHLSYKRAKLDAQLFGTPTRWNERIASGLSLV
ncbi:acyl-CoA dehydrogenase family protein [soil metagenome]